MENAAATEPVSVAPGATWASATSMTFSRDPLESFCDGNPDEPECVIYDD